MNILQKSGGTFAGLTLIAAVLAVGAGQAIAGATKVTLSGAQEVPAVETSAAGSGTITVNDDMTISGSVTTKGVKAVAAHIHEGAPGKNGGVVVPLEKKSDNEWAVPAGAKLTDEQYKSYKAGNLYVNVHSDAHKAGEIRGQLKPSSLPPNITVRAREWGPYWTCRASRPAPRRDRLPCPGVNGDSHERRPESKARKVPRIASARKNSRSACRHRRQERRVAP